MRAAGVEMWPTSKPWKLLTISYRNHRKIVVVDGRVALAGGLDIGHEHVDPGDGFELWRDTHLRIEGPAVPALQRIFAVDWANACGDRLLSAGYFPMDEIARHPGSDGPEERPRTGPGGGPPVFEGVPVQVALSGPDSEWHAIRQLYLALITNARREILLTSPYFVLDAGIAEALCSAALAGVDARVMVSARKPGWPVPNWAANTYAAEVAESGVKVLLCKKGYLHAETVCVDGRICTVGSANRDIRSFSINYEMTSVLYHDDLAQAVREAFLRDEADCRLFDLGAYRAHSAPIRLRDSAARLASPLL